MERECHCRSAREMHDLGVALAEGLRVGDCLALCGELGAGKTQFVKGLAAGLGFAGAVTSPTFVLLHEYRGGRVPLFHLDFYRTGSEAEILQLGWDGLLEEGVVVAEWADRYPSLLPADARWVRISHAPEEGRLVRLS